MLRVCNFGPPSQRDERSKPGVSVANPWYLSLTKSIPKGWQSRDTGPSIPSYIERSSAEYIANAATGGA